MELVRQRLEEFKIRCFTEREPSGGVQVKLSLRESRSMRRHLAWPLALPLSVLGVLAAHWLSYRLVVPDSHAREHLLAATGHGYLMYAPAIVGISLALIALGFGHAIVREFRGESPATTAPAWLVGFVPLLAFVIQEYVERCLQHGSIEWGVALESTFVVGLALAGAVRARRWPRHARSDTGRARRRNDPFSAPRAEASEPPSLPAPRFVRPSAHTDARARVRRSGSSVSLLLAA